MSDYGNIDFRALTKNYNNIFEDYIRTYLQLTGSRIEDLIMVQQTRGDKIHFWLERKDGK